MGKIKTITINGVRLVMYPQSLLKKKYNFSRLMKGCRFCYFFDEGDKTNHCKLTDSSFRRLCRMDTGAIIFLDKKRYLDHIRRYNNLYDESSQT